MATTELHHAGHKVMGACADGKVALIRVAAEAIQLVYRFVEEFGAGLDAVILANLGPEVGGFGGAKDSAELAIVPIGRRTTVLDACGEEGITAVIGDVEVAMIEEQAGRGHADTASAALVDPDFEDGQPDCPVERVGDVGEAKPKGSHTDISIVAIDG